MTATGFDRLKNLSAAPPASAPAGLTRDRLREGWVIACDQSLDGFGWVYLVNDAAGCRVVRAESFSTAKPNDSRGRPIKGHPLNLARGVEVYTRFQEILAQCWASGTDVVYETPPAGGRMARPESSLLSALAIKIACLPLGIEAVMVGAQTAKKVFTGNANADKPEAHRAMMHQVSGWLEGIEAITNEAKRDALMLGLTRLSQGGS